MISAFSPTLRLDLGPGAPLGALARDGGVDFTVLAPRARAVELCLFTPDGRTETHRLPLHGPVDGLWHGFLPGAGPGLVYGYRAHGRWAPAEGLRYNPHKLLLDPAAREIVGRFAWRPEHHAYELGHAEGHLSFDSRDNAAIALKARVPPPPAPAPGALNAPRIPPAERLLYEVHVRGFSMAHPGIPAALRGTYAGLAHPAAIAHFRALGVTTLSLLPVHYHLDEPMLPPGRVNYWGYNSLGFFAPDPRLSCTPDDPGAVNDEFRRMVATLHGHGLEVVLDVVYNHTPEGNEQGPSISFRGLDNQAWYHLDAQGGARNWSACGNTLNLAEPQVARFVLDSLRYWVQEMGVDGFRFDLAAVLGRGRDGAFSAEAGFFTALRQCPVLAHALLIAEPWDAGPEGYRVGHFPGRFAEWNDKFRDAARGFWLGRGEVTPDEFATRFGASPDIYRRPGAQRLPSASVNFISVHDGFTLADFTAYAAKHNHANGEDNRDGRDDELCANFGVEGPSADPAVNETRRRVRRALLATLLLAQGTPMLCAGDEFGNSQQGNNNAWNQDNALGWLDWGAAATPEGAALTALVQALAALRRAEPLLRSPHWRQGPDCTWHGLHPAHGLPGRGAGVLACELHDGRTRLLLAFNSGPAPAALAVAPPPGQAWQLLLDSSDELAPGPLRATPLAVPARSVLVLRALAP